MPELSLTCSLEEPCLWTIARMRDALARKLISAQEILESHHRQFDRLNPRLNAFCARIETRTSTVMGPLAGIPITIKDSLDVEGHSTACGLKSRLMHRAAQDALCVQRLKSAGAVILGKTNTPEWLMNWETTNEVYGETVNPWDTTRTAGGSSGGEAAAISSCMSAGGIGSDGGGSIRLPSALTGICGLKPTPGRVPAKGHFPSVGHPGGLLGVIGPMARTVADVETLFGVVAGHDDGDPFSVPFTPSGPSWPCKVAIVEDSTVERSLSWVSSEVEVFGFQDWERVYEVWSFFFMRLNAHAIGVPLIRTAEYLEQPIPELPEILAMFAARDALRARFLKFMDETPIVLLPNPGFGAWKVGEFPGLRAMHTYSVANLLGLPALAIPIGFDEQGLPLAIQALAKPWREELLLEFGKDFELRRGAFPLPPMAGGL